MSKAIAILSLFALSTAGTVVVMINGYGVHVASYGWIIAGAIFQLIMMMVIQNIAAEM